MNDHVVTRFAPSPTGHLHIGGARSALFCWAFAKNMGGRFMLRIEDTDAARSSDESARGIMEDLAWLGIDWDDGPTLTLPAKTPGAVSRTIGAEARDVGSYFQARRVAIYDRFVEQLVQRGRAYPAFETNEEVEAQRKAAIAAKHTYRYQRPGDIEFGVFNASLESRWRRAQAGERHVIRFAAPHEAIVVQDQVLGDVSIAAGELDDFVIRKADGFPTYHFAVVVDDETMGVTHVLRAQEHLANTPRHVALQRALTNPQSGKAFRVPVYGHMPLIFNVDGTKMSKRDKAKTARKVLKDAIAASSGKVTLGVLAPQLSVDAKLLADFAGGENDSLEIAEQVARHFKVTLPEIEVCDFREAGYLPEAICNYIALLGWNPGMKNPDGKDLEKFDNAFIAEHFSIERIGRTNAKFDRAKLLSFNADAIGSLSDQEFLARWGAWLAEFDAPAHARITGLSATARELLVRVIKPRAKTLRDALKSAAFLMRADNSREFDGGAVEKTLKAEGGKGLALVREFREILRGVDQWTPQSLHHALEDFARSKGYVSEKGVNVGPVAQPMRVAIAGVAVTPQLGETLAILGKERTLARIEVCLSQSA